MLRNMVGPDIDATLDQILTRFFDKFLAACEQYLLMQEIHAWSLGMHGVRGINKCVVYIWLHVEDASK